MFQILDFDFALFHKQNSLYNFCLYFLDISHIHFIITFFRFDARSHLDYLPDTIPRFSASRLC